MKRIWVPLVVLGAILAVVAASASARSEKSTATAQACVLLPDKTTSVRYELYDRPYLSAAFKKAKVSYNILNALGSQTTQRSQADQCITNGAKVILVDPLDSGTGASIENAAAAKGVKTIDYDRLTLNGKASYYVSFDNVVVGKTMGNGLVAALKKSGAYSKHPVVAELNGGITDNNATLFKQGYDSVLKPLYAKGVFKKAKSGDQWTDWDAGKAQTIFEQMETANGNGVNAAIAANDNLAGGVITVLKNKHLKPIPVTGQDASPQGVQYILAGWQSGTVWKNNLTEANAAAKVAVQIIKGQKVTGINAKANNKSRMVPSIYLTPTWVTTANYTQLFTSGTLKKSQVCIGVYKKLCK
jgi:D-xylose transport system substrate-binding protein